MPNDQQPNDQPVVTNSWTGYQEFTKRVHDFLGVISVRDNEVWLDEICLGSPDRPWIRAPFEIDSVERVGRAIENAQRLTAAVKGSLQNTIETSKREMEGFGSKVADRADLEKLVARLDALDELRTELSGAAAGAPFEYHPAVLISSHRILQHRFGPGDPSVVVKVTTTYVL